jgi:hypothetical protein
MSSKCNTELLAFPCQPLKSAQMTCPHKNATGRGQGATYRLQPRGVWVLLYLHDMSVQSTQKNNAANKGEMFALRRNPSHGETIAELDETSFSASRWQLYIYLYLLDALTDNPVDPSGAPQSL